MRITKIISTTRDATGRLIAKFLRNGKNDVQEVVMSMPPGIDSNPIKDQIAFHEETGVSGESVLIGVLNKDGEALPGEIRIYSTDDSGELQIYLWVKKNGTIEFGGSAGNLVRFQELETGYNQLKSDFNSLVTAFNSHMHATAATGPPVPPTPIPGSIPTTPSTADISGAKIDELKTL